MKILDSALLTNLSRQATASRRLRQNFNLHDSLEEPCQRLLIAIEPGSYIRPHRHLKDPKPECLIGLRGRMALVTFGEGGDVEGVQGIGSAEEVLGADIPAGVWHTLVCLQSGSVFFETKPGPYRPNAEEDMAPWAPEEGSPEAVSYLQGLTDKVQQGKLPL
jgi:cupin fold WbuC family metalloprotein